VSKERQQSAVQLDQRRDRACTVQDAYNGVGVGIMLSEFSGISHNLNISMTVGVVQEISGRFAYNKKSQRPKPKKTLGCNSLSSTLTHWAMAHGKGGIYIR
jgi:hypothetical protein